VISKIAVGVARLFFSTAVLLMICATGFAYLSYRILYWIAAGDKPMPVRTAAFGVLTSVVALAQAVKANSKVPGYPPTETGSTHNGPVEGVPATWTE
jgi:hypothetical protein